MRLKTGTGLVRPVGLSLCSMRREQMDSFSVVVTDLTERKAAEAELRAANENLESRVRERTAELRVKESAIRSSITAIAIADLQGKLTYVNPAFLTLWGYEHQEEVLGRSVLDFWEEPERALEVVQAIRTGQSWVGELAALRKNGTRLTLHFSASTVLDDAGRPLCLMASFLDITERKRAEEALRESESRFRSLFESSPDAVFLTIPDGRVVAANPAACATFLMSEAEICRVGRDGLIDRDDPRHCTVVQERRRTGRVTKVELSYIRKNGERFLAEVDSVILPGEPLRSFVILRDITERKRGEELLLRSEARLAQAVELSGLGIFEHDHRRDVLDWSPELYNIFGFERHKPVTVAIMLEQVVPEDREVVGEAIRRAHDPAGDGRFELEFRILNQNGRVRWISARSQTFFGGAGSELRAVRTIGAVRDITERKEFQVELEQLVAERTARLEELVGELEHFSYTITHDMRAPLRAMKGYGEVVNELCAECPMSEPKGFLRRIMVSADRMDALIRDALNYSRAVRQELPLELVDTGALLRGMLDSYPEFQRSKASIQVDGALPVVMGNEAGLTQCFSNLLGNAVKFAKPGHPPEIRIWAEMRPVERQSVEASGHETFEPGHAPRSTLHASTVRIWVEDKGVGIPKELLPRVFDMFARGQNTHGGTGIGLALVRKVMDRMEGKVGVESEEGKGSRFWLDLKLGDPRRAQPRAEATRMHPDAVTS